ncbi:acid-sensing ion channel 4-A-like [Tachypleus tridentatus]|uniref:acid-sensing ion channel 4-A-like n=1 Tax=Tachypleus tridentatus TaxID=6853 RepID=UPI003FD014BB
MAHNVILRDNVSVWLAGLQRRDKFTAFRIGHQLEDFLVQCIFEGKSCSSIKYFARKGNALYGNCYVFNSRAFPTNYSKEIKRITRHSGPRHGLELILYVEPNEYMPIIKEQGAYVMVHSPDAEGSHMNSMYVRSGESTYIGLKTTHIDRKPYPYPDKCRNNWPEWFEDMNSKSTVSYTREGCLQRCSQKKIVENCGCELAWMPSCNPGRNYTICDFYGNDEVNNCIHRTKFEGIDCSCTPRCHGLLRIVVYYNTFNYEEIRQEPKYTFSRLVSNIGGTLGLYTGLSFLAGMEILGQILKIFKNSLHKIRKKNITPVDQLEV